jgi:hypothetical protein
MKPFQQLKNLKRIIKDMENDLPYSKNQLKDGSRYNDLIDVHDCFDGMLVSKCNTDASETLIYALIYELLMTYKAYEQEIPLPEIIKTIDDCFTYGVNPKKQECISILKHHELTNKIKDNSVFDDDYADFNKMLTDLVTDFKTNIQYAKS